MAGSPLREILARFSVDVDTSKLDAGESAVGRLVGQLQGLGEVLAGAAIVQGVRVFADEFVNLATEISDTSQVLGTNTQALQEWRLAAQLSGLSAQALDGAFLRLQDGIADNAPALRRMGVATRDASGNLRGAVDVLQDMADPLAAMGEAERSATLMELFGRNGARLGPLLARGSEGLAELRGELERLGGGVSPEAIAAADELGDAWDRLDIVGRSLRSRLALFLLPALERLSAGATAAGAAFTRMSDRGRILEAVLVVVGGAAAAAGARTAAAWLAAAAPFVALGVLLLGLVLIVEDLWVGLEGGRSTLGDLGLAWEEWGKTADGVLSGVATAIEFVKGLLLSAVQLIGELAGYDLLSGGTGDLALRGAGASAEDDAANAIVQRRREDLSSVRVPLPLGLSAAIPAESLIPDSVERFLALREARSAAAPSVTIGRIDTTGMTPEQAARMVEQSVSSALARQSDDLEDTLTQ